MSRHHTRRRFDDEVDHRDHPVDHPRHRPDPPASTEEPPDQHHDEPSWSSYHDPGVLHGPDPVPPWVITSSAAIDTDLGVLKSGKEADVSLLVRRHHDQSVHLAVKRYRSAEHRLFHRDAMYLEGRKERKSRQRRAMENRTDFGRELIAVRWAAAEFHVLSQLWAAGAAVPYPVQLSGTELMMEFIGDADGVAAPRLAQMRPDVEEARDWYAQLRAILLRLAEASLAHGDLSPYNVLVHEGRLVLIDLPQAVDLVGNPQAEQLVRRDCDNVVGWFRSRGLDVEGAALADEILAAGRGWN